MQKSFDRQSVYCERLLQEMNDRGQIKDPEIVLYYLKLAYATGFDEGRYYKNPQQTRIVGQFTRDGLRVKEYPSLQAAANAVGVSKSAIHNACNGKAEFIKGYRWLYIE